MVQKIQSSPWVIVVNFVEKVGELEQIDVVGRIDDIEKNVSRGVEKI